MEFTLENRQNNSIVSYENTQVLLSNQTLTLPCFISKTYQTTTLSIKKLQDCQPKNIKPFILQDKVDLLIVGTGAKQQFLPPKTQVALQNMGLLLEVMPNHSAVRCYNLLLSDYRNVGLLLLEAFT